ncbi:uncharacterized protein LOC144513928 isoform X2 [Sander vitreus]
MEAGDTELNNTNEQMIPVEEPAQNDVQKVPEICFQDDEVTNECDPKDQQDKNTITTDPPKTSPRDNRSVSPLGFLREDFSQFKEELLKVFRDKDTDQSSQAARTHDALKDDLSRFKVDVASVFKSADPKSSQSAEKTINRLSFLHFKDHVSNVFRLGPSKEPDSSNAFKIKAPSKEPDSSNAFKIKASSKEPDSSNAFKIKASSKEPDSSNAFKIKAPSKEPDSSNAFKIKASSKEPDSSNAFKIKASSKEPDSSNAFKIKASSKEPDSSNAFKIKASSKEPDSSNAFKIKASSKEPDSSNAFKIKAPSKEPDSSNAFKIKASSKERDNEVVMGKDYSSNAFKIKASMEQDIKGVMANEDSSNAFKIKASSDIFTLNPSKERDNEGVTANEDSSDAFKIKASIMERDNKGVTANEDSSDAFKIKAESESGAEDTNIISETSEQTKEEMDAGFKGNVSEQNEETVDAEKINDKDVMNEVEVNETINVSETQHSEEKINLLSFLHFTDHVLNVFRLSPSKEPDSSNAFKIKASSKERDSSNAFKIKASSDVFTLNPSKERDNEGVTANEDSSDAFKIKASIMERDNRGVTEKEDSSDAFKIKASIMERDNEGVTANEDSSDAFKIKASIMERDNEGVTANEDSSDAFKIKAESESGAEDTNIISETSEQTKEEMDAGFKGNVSEQNEETVDAEKINDNLKDVINEVEVNESEEKINRLSFLHFKDHVSNVFRLSPSKERDSSNAFKIKASSKERDNEGVTAEEDPSNAFKIKAEGTNEPFLLSLFRKTSQKVENGAEDEKIISEMSEQTKEMDASFKENVLKQNEETVDEEKINSNLKDVMNEVEVNETINVSETQHSEEKINRLSFLNLKDVSNVFRLSPSKERDHKGITAKEDSSNAFKIKAERTDEPFLLSLFKKTLQKVENVPENENITSEIRQFAGFKGNEETVDAEKINDNLKDGMNEMEVNEITSLSETQHREEMIPTSQAVACYLTFDPNTANSELRLSDSNRTVTRVWTELWPPEHPDRFQSCPQVLCREGLLDSAYWEAEWSAGADIGVAYNDICRDGDAARCLLGHNARSWSLECSEGSYTACHANRRFRVAAPRPFARRVGVHLDWSAGALSFYCVSQDAMVHLHTFRDTFTEPLYPAFWVWAYDGSVSLSQVELDWERLLQ